MGIRKRLPVPPVDDAAPVWPLTDAESSADIACAHRCNWCGLGIAGKDYVVNSRRPGGAHMHLNCAYGYWHRFYIAVGSAVPECDIDEFANVLHDQNT